MDPYPQPLPFVSKIVKGKAKFTIMTDNLHLTIPFPTYTLSPVCPVGTLTYKLIVDGKENTDNWFGKNDD